MSNLYVYVLEAFAYSDFEYYLLFHGQKYSKEEFLRIVTDAKEKVKKDNFNDEYGYFFPQNVIEALKKEYGFVEKYIPVVDLRGGLNDTITMWG